MLLPAGARIAVHWGADGVANGFANKTSALLVLPAAAAALSLLFAVLPRIDPRARNLAGSRPFYVAGWLGTLGVVAVAQGAIVATALRAPVDTRTIVSAAVALLFIVLGNFLGKTRSNFFAGVRTPWTLSSDYSWQRSNRLAGRLFMAAGAVTLAAIPFLPPKAETRVFIAAALVAAVVPAAMSYVYWRDDPERSPGH